MANLRLVVSIRPPLQRRAMALAGHDQEGQLG